MERRGSPLSPGGSDNWSWEASALTGTLLPTLSGSQGLHWLQLRHPAEASDGLPLLKASVSQPGCTVATILGVAPWGAMEGDRSEGVSANGRAWARGPTKHARLWELLREER